MSTENRASLLRIATAGSVARLGATVRGEPILMDDNTIGHAELEVGGGEISVAQSWRHGTSAHRDRTWRPGELGPVVRDLVERAPAPEPDPPGLPGRVTDPAPWNAPRR